MGISNVGNATVGATSVSGDGLIADSYNYFFMSAITYTVVSSGLGSATNPLQGTGTYIYTKNSGTSATLLIAKTASSNVGTVTLAFSSASGGSFTLSTSRGGSASGTFAVR